jgi:hypothetical protein
MDTENVVHMHGMDYYSTKEMMKSYNCKNMGRIGGHYVKWNIPGTEGQLPHYLTGVKSEKRWYHKRWE